MNSDKRYFLLGIFVTIVFGIIVNVLTPYFLESQLAWLLLLLASIVFLVSIFNQEIRTWLAKKSLISKKKRIEELQREIEKFDKVRLLSRNNPNKFILLVINKYIIWLLALFFLLFSRVSLKSLIDVFTGSPNADIFDFYTLAELIFSFMLMVNFFSLARNGWVFLENIADDTQGDDYRENLITEIRWLTSKITDKEKSNTPEANSG